MAVVNIYRVVLLCVCYECVCDMYLSVLSTVLFIRAVTHYVTDLKNLLTFLIDYT